ncbi:MAG: radical SAM protein [Candidatus Wallbacteria bacterium]|nr:radical SAM protein [Candidatus Wallbacteria bacterium]
MDYEYFKITRSLCPECGKIVQAKIVFENDCVYLLKHCPVHGESLALIYRDRETYLRNLRINKPALYPLEFEKKYQGCPDSCGLCNEHQQHTCLPIIEITDHCNFKCPICIADNRSSFFMEPAEFKKIIERLVRTEGNLELINLSGGEPTLHPQLTELLDIALRQEILGVSISTNGRLFLKKPELLAELLRRNIFISLQFDGFSDAYYQALRGENLLDEKLKILEMLEKRNAPSSLVMTVARNANLKGISQVLEFFLQKDFLRSIMFQPLSFANPGVKYDFQDVTTIQEVIAEIAAGSRGMIREEDIVSLPCSHPACFSLTYLLKLGQGEFIPLNRLAKADDYLDLIKNRAMAGFELETYEKIRECIYDLWSSSGIQPESQKILATIKKIICEVDGESSCEAGRLFSIAGSHVKSIFIHHFMDRHNFDLSRAMKCCTQYQINGSGSYPCCVFNNLQRRGT